jgi:ABC-type multidrug transport system fused ATPase/permease subunit
MSNPTIYGNLSNQFPDSTLLTGQTDLKNSINSLNTNLDAINNKTNNLLTQQDTVSKIVNEEQSRLKEKKQMIDNAYSSQVRSIQLNDSINKRYQAYLKIIFVFIIVLIVALIVSIIGKSLPIIPSFVLYIIHIGLFSFALIYSFGIYLEVQKHEKINYDRLYMKKATDGSLDVSGTRDISGIDASGNKVTGNCAKVDPLTGNCTQLLESFCGMSHLPNINSYEFTTYSKY